MKILAVDDDPIILELLTEVLHVVGFSNLTMCGSAHEALDLIAEATVPFDCFLLDIQMPVMDGIELTAAIRALPQHTKTPILMITAMSDRSYIDGAFGAGATDYITKPFEVGEVHARLRLIESLVLERKQQNDRNPVTAPSNASATVTASDLESRLSLPGIDGFIDYLALENYLMQVSRASLFGMSAFGVVVPDFERVFQSSSLYEFESAVTDFAEAISDCLKPEQFFAAHAGGGEFICILTGGPHFDAEAFEEMPADKITEMDLHFCDGRPMTLKPVVGDAFALQLKSSRGVASTLVRALSEAEMTARSPRSKAPEQSSGTLKALFGF